jgi:hypothetical protein
MLVQAAVAGTIAAPASHSRLLEMIVTARHYFAGRSLLDQQTELVFEVALGQKAEEVRKLYSAGARHCRPVAASGQPTATSAPPTRGRPLTSRAALATPNTILAYRCFTTNG